MFLKNLFKQTKYVVINAGLIQYQLCKTHKKHRKWSIKVKIDLDLNNHTHGTTA